MPPTRPRSCSSSSARLRPWVHRSRSRSAYSTGLIGALKRRRSLRYRVSPSLRCSISMPTNSNASGADYTTTFTSGGPAIPIADTDTLIADADSTTIASATITIGINRESDDVLSIVGALPAGIAPSIYNSSSGVLTLTGVATLADYQTALQQVAYSSTNPT